MQYPTATVLERLAQRAKRLRNRIPDLRAQADREHADKVRAAGDRIAVAERRRDQLRQTLDTDGITWAEIYESARELAEAARQAACATGNGPSYKSAEAFERDAQEIDGLVELIRSTGAKTIPTSELEKLGALRWVR